jgi:Cd2+/Zn2+-exporting ATPase
MTETENVKQSTRYHVEGMDCSSCAIKIENVLKRVSGITNAHVNTGSGMVTLSGEFDRDAAGTAMGKLGYKVRQIKQKAKHDENDGHDHSHVDPSEFNKPWWQTAKGKLVIISATLVGLSFVADKIFPALGMWPFIVATLVALYPVAKRAFAAARMGSVFTIEMLMTIAAVGALAIHAAEEAAVVVLLFAVGEVLEGVAASRARKSISALGELAPKTALLIEGEQKKEVPVETLLPGQLVLVRPGDRIPCDGKIKEGVSEINEAPVTGESVPRSKAIGEEVFAGTINISAAITVEVTRAAADNTIARIIRLVDEAQSAKAPVQRFVDKFARIYMPIVVGIALLVALIPPLVFDGAWDIWTYRALALLLIACPCALVISTPAAIAAGMSAGARRGLLIKGGVVLESLGALKTICFDKTGTLTEGKPKVTDLKGFTISDEETLRLIGALENGSNHPIAKAVLAYASEKGVSLSQADDVKIISGKGLSGTVEGRDLLLISPRAALQEGNLSAEVTSMVDAVESAGKTAAILMENSHALGLFAVRDEPRDDAREGLKALSALGVKGIMLTGDNRRTADAVAASLGLEARSELLPEDKARIVKELDESGQGPVGKVGDGINDAPALAAARVGIAMGGGTDVALETADAALLNNSVMGVADLIKLSRATLANIRINIILALGSKAIFLVTTVLGITGMWIAVMADTGATVLVTLNALRLLNYKKS